VIAPLLEQPSSDPVRWIGSDRRDALLDAAADMVAKGRVDLVSMESVAAAAGVSRSLVYKHFANRGDLLTALYERESSLLHSQLADQVGAARGLRDKLRVLIRGAIAAQQTRGSTFAVLNSVGARGSHQRSDRRRRNSQTLRYFTELAMREFNLDEQTARAGMAMVLGSIATVLAQWRHAPSSEEAQRLEDAFVDMSIGGLAQLARSPSDNNPGSRTSH